MEHFEKNHKTYQFSHGSYIANLGTFTVEYIENIEVFL